MEAHVSLQILKKCKDIFCKTSWSAFQKDFEMSFDDQYLIHGNMYFYVSRHIDTA